MTENGVDENGSFIVGASSAYDYSSAAGRTTVTTTEQADPDEGETANNVVTTTYTFDDDGNILGEYVCTEDTGNVGVGGEVSGIHPYLTDGGASVNRSSNNLLYYHNFESLQCWSELPSCCDDFSVSADVSERDVKFGQHALCMAATPTECVECAENGIYQVTTVLPVGEYTFSAYVRVVSSFQGSETCGAYLRVTDTCGNVLAVTERLQYKESEYTRLIAPFVLDAEQSVQVEIVLDGAGTVYVDAAQLEKNPYASAYNMIENGDGELNSHGWKSAGYTYITDGTSFNGTRTHMIYGDLECERNFYQNIVVHTFRSTRESFTLSGWAKGYGLPTHEREGVETPRFRLRAVIKYYDCVYKEFGTETFTADFSPCTEDWQFASVEIAKSKYSVIWNMQIFCDYDYNSGVAYFDDIQLVRNSVEFGLSAADFVEEANEEIEEEGVGAIETTDEAPIFEEVKDAFGNALTETTFTDGEFGTIYRAFKFNESDDCYSDVDDAGNDLIEETDARGNKTTYTVDGDTSRNEVITDRCGNKTAYEYDANGRTTKVTSKDATGKTLAQVSYAYDAFDNMTEIVRGDGMKYALKYNAFHNLESIGIDGKTENLITYTYKNGNGRLKEMKYANGDTMKATYNSIGQMIAEKWYNASNELTAHYKYAYDNQGNIVRSIDILAKKEYNYTYEEGRIVRSTEADIELNGEVVISKTVKNPIRYTYDSEGNLILVEKLMCMYSEQRYKN